MKTYYKVTLALLAGIGIGSGAVQALYAQSRPPVYVITEIDVTNQEAYVSEYVPKIRLMVKAAGGRPVAATAKVIPIEGEPPKGRVVIQVWDSMDQLQAYRNSADYKETRQIGDKYARFRIFAVDGVAQ